MSAGKVIAYIAAAIFIIFGALFILAAFGNAFTTGNFITGLVLVGIGFGLIWFAGRQKPVTPGEQNVTVNIDLPGNVELESMKCKTCGGTLTSENIKLVNGAPVVTCPYCGSVYQLTEEPKW
jgi:DNA-directed RNA polymerase subunit RPC12/RpoP